MAEAGAPALADGERRALFRLLAPESGGHHYATLRAHDTGPERFTLEVRRGLVWGFTQQVLVVRARTREGGGLALAVAGGAGPDEPAGDVGGDDLDDFAGEALRIAAERLGVDAGAFYAASHVDLGESGTLGVEAPVRQRSSALLDRLARARPAGAPASLPEEADPATPPRPAEDAPSAPPPADRPAPDAPAAASRPLEAPAPTAAASGEARNAAPSAAAAAPAPREAPRPAAATPAASPNRPAHAAPEEGSPGARGLLNRIVGWLRRAARAALGG